MTTPRTDLTKVAQMLLKSRQTAHDFLPDAVPAAAVRRALNCALRAPNHHLTNPWRFAWLGPHTRDALARTNAQLELDRRGESAAQAKYTRWLEVPGWMLVTSLRDGDVLREQENYAATCCAIHNFVLSLHAEGIRCKWTSGAITRLPAFAEITGLDTAHEQFVGLIWFGYARRKTPATKRRPLSEVLRKTR